MLCKKKYKKNNNNHLATWKSPVQIRPAGHTFDTPALNFCLIFTAKYNTFCPPPHPPRVAKAVYYTFTPPPPLSSEAQAASQTEPTHTTHTKLLFSFRVETKTWSQYYTLETRRNTHFMHCNSLTQHWLFNWQEDMNTSLSVISKLNKQLMNWKSTPLDIKPGWQREWRGKSHDIILVGEYETLFNCVSANSIDSAVVLNWLLVS